MKDYELPQSIKTFCQIFVPDALQGVVSVLSAAVLYMALSARYFWERLSGESLTTRKYSDALLTDVVQNFGDIPYASTIVIVAIWGMVGVLGYLLTLFLINGFISIENNNEMNQGMKSRLIWQLFHQYRRIIWVVLTVIVLALTFLVALPFWLECFSVFNQFPRSEWQVFVVALLGLAYNLYLLFAFLSAVKRNPRL